MHWTVLIGILICCPEVLPGVAEETSSPPPPQQQEAAEAGQDPEQPDADTYARSQVFGAEAPGQFSLHRLNYVALGPDDAKMQFSFKYRLLHEQNWFFAYTNIVTWDIWDDSIPYRDISFIPEFFWRYEPKDTWLSTLDIGYYHNSNGKDGTASRAWDRLGARTAFAGRLWERDIFVIPAAYATISLSRQNPDLHDYLGFWDVTGIGHRLLNKDRENLDVIMNLQSGRNHAPFDRGAFTLSFRYKLRKSAFAPYLYAQYFTGYGDTILEYNKHRDTVRFGMAFYY